MFKLLKTFRVVYETRNFSKAAEQLYISQPAVSHQIKQLEEELDRPLFIRNGRQDIYPTKQGDILYARFLNLADDWEETIAAIHKEEAPKETCRIVASNTFAVYYLPELFETLVTEFPSVSFTLSMNNSEEVVEKIEKRQADFGFIEKPLITKDIFREKIITDELVLAGVPTSNNRWFLREKNSGVYHYTERYLQETNQKPDVVIVQNNEMIIKCLERGLGRSLLSKKAVTPAIPYTSLGSEYQRSFYYLKRNHLNAPLLQEVGTAISQFYRSFSEKA